MLGRNMSAGWLTRQNRIAEEPLLTRLSPMASDSDAASWGVKLNRYHPIYVPAADPKIALAPQAAQSFFRTTAMSKATLPTSVCRRTPDVMRVMRRRRRLPLRMRQ